MVFRNKNCIFVLLLKFKNMNLDIYIGIHAKIRQTVLKYTELEFDPIILSDTGKQMLLIKWFDDDIYILQENNYLRPERDLSDKELMRVQRAVQQAANKIKDRNANISHSWLTMDMI